MADSEKHQVTSIVQLSPPRRNVMKHALPRSLAVIVLGLATFTAVAAHAQTTAPGPYYATPSWDQTLPSSTRFIVLTNMNSAAVLDRETGLVWQRSPAPGGEQGPFGNASEYCVNSRIGNRLGWRLPTINELASLFDPSQTSPPFLPSGHPFTGLPLPFAFFWSATPDLNNTVEVAHKALLYSSGDIGLSVNGTLSDANNTATVWCVRGGLLAGPQ